MRKNELKVYYDATNGIDAELDKAITEAVKPFGYEWWTSGCDTGGKVRIRDIGFDKRK